MTNVRLSIVIICWNDLKVIRDCLQTIHEGTRATEFEVIVSDNGSRDGSVEFIKAHYPHVRVIENRQNLGFAKGNNVGIRASNGDWVLVLNPDTLVHDGTLERLVAFAEEHPEAGAVGCRVLNPDGSYQISARPFPTIWRSWLAALCLRNLAYLSDVFMPDIYTNWKGDTERNVDWQSGCCVMFRGSLLRALGGFDEQFFYQYEEVDLCYRVWQAGYSVRFTPAATITHLGGQSVGRFRLRFEIEKHRNRYRYFYKHFGALGARRVRWASIAYLRVRQAGYSLRGLFGKDQALKERLQMYSVVADWNYRLDPVLFAQRGEEPAVSAFAAS
jgi:GT2 family glycosyltransferase